MFSLSIQGKLLETDIAFYIFILYNEGNNIHLRGKVMEILPYYQKEVICLHCKHKFKSTKIRSKFIKLETHDTDFQPIYQNKEINPLLYNVFVCKQCGFSFTDDFTKYFAPSVKEAIQENVTNHWTTRSYGGERSIQDGITAYKLGILCASLKKEKFVSIAGLALRVAWLYRSLGLKDEEKRFMEIARDRYIDSYSNEDYKGTQMSEIRILYLIAELSRRMGALDFATRYFSKVLEKQSSSIEPKLIEMAKDRWQEMRS